MAREDYQDWLSSQSGASAEDYDTDFKAAGNIKDIYDTTVGRFIKGYNKGKSTKSIIGMAAKNTFDFPVFISKSIPLDYATATNQLLEQLYASYLQMAISQQPFVDARSVKHGGFLANYQTNITKYVEYTDMAYQHEACHNEIVTEDAKFTFDMLNCSRPDADVILECMDYEPLSEFQHFFQERREIVDDYGPESRRHLELRYDNHGNFAGFGHRDEEIMFDDHGREVAIGGRGRTHRRHEIAPREIESRLKIEDTDTQGRRIYDDNGRRIPNPQRDEYSQFRRQQYREKQKHVADTEKSRADAMVATNNANNWKAVENDRREEHSLKMMNRAPEVLKEDDMKKINSMKPLLMKVQLTVTEEGKPDVPKEFIVGVHTHCRLVDPETWPDVAKYPLKEMNELTRHAKYKAGELRFMRDIVFQINEKKQTAIDSKDPKKKWYRRLYELSHTKGDAKVAGKVSGNSTTGLIPNATIMMSNSDVENVKSQTKLDLMKPSLAKRLCKELFLIAFVVIDQDAESIKLFIPDLYGDWDVHSLASVEKQLAELSTSGSKTRDLFKMLK